ncbi:MAG: serine/threonine protein kinase, partial [Bacteroidales bacterium]|nr:serine/threonine protein kinase [Bacteroidales bacterium]
MASINDEYEKLQIIGQGSFATIWKVRHRKYGYIRTLKILNTPVQDENDHAYQQFVKECTVLLNIGNGSNNNIVHIYQPRLIDNRAVVEMDYIDGETLDQYLRRNKFMPIDEVLRFIGDIGGALAYCHHDIYKYMMNPNEDDLKSDPDDGRRYIIDEATEQRLVRKYAVTHNDLHSNNVMRRENDGSYVLLDFGLAIQNGTAVKSSALRGGALEYMAPEKFEDNTIITTQSDIYSFGILMYEALAGRVPFVLGQGASFSDQTLLYQQHKTGIAPEIEPLRREAFEAANPGQTYHKDYPDWLEAMIMRCLEKDPDRRYADAKELMNEFYSNRRVFVDENSLSERVNIQLDNNNYDVFISFSTQD